MVHLKKNKFHNHNFIFTVNYLKGQEAYLLHTGHFDGYEEGTPINIALSHDYFTVALSVGQTIKYFNSKTEELEDNIPYAHPGNAYCLFYFHNLRFTLQCSQSNLFECFHENIITLIYDMRI